MMKRIQLANYKAEHFGYAVAGKVATITLNRPERKNPLTLDSKEPTISLEKFAYNETRFRMLLQSNEERAESLMKLAQHDVRERWHHYQDLATEEEFKDNGAMPTTQGNGTTSH